MNKKIMVSITILLGFFYLTDFSYARFNFGITGAIKNRGEDLKEKVEKKREEIFILNNPQNNPPSIPSNPTPADGATDQLVTVDLSWTGGDPDTGDIVTYELYFGNSTNPPLISDDQTTTTYNPVTLSCANTYYWKVVAKDNNGACSSGPVWTLKTSRWGAPQLIESDNEGNARYSQVAIDSSGNAIAVWMQYDGLRDNIWSNRYELGTGWGTAQLIETDDAGSAGYSQVAIDSSGNAIAVWVQYDGIRFNIWSNRYELGTGWGTAQLIENDNAGDVYYPQIAINSSGNAIAVWRQNDGLRDNIWSNRYELGTGWGTAQLIETDDAGSAGGSQIAIDSSGNAIAVWSQSDGTRSNIWSNRYVSGTGWGTAQLIETDDAGSAGGSQIAIDSSGNAIAVWEQHDGTRANICSNRYELGTGWGTAQLIETDDAGSAWGSQIAIDSSGNAIAVWVQYDGIRFNIWSNRYELGTGWGVAQLIETDDAGSAGGSQIAIDSSGNAIAVWQQHDGTRSNIWSNRYELGTGWGTAHLIADNTGYPYYPPQVAIDSSGNALAVWTQGGNIYSNRYENE